MSSMSTGLSRQEKRASPSRSVAPLAVPPQEAARLLSLGIWRIYQLMRTGELVSYRDGRARRITMASIHDRMARQIAAASADGWRRIEPNPSPCRKARGESVQDTRRNGQSEVRVVRMPKESHRRK